jgi:hypothetical protein
MTEDLSQCESSSARCYSVLHICVPLDASVDQTEARNGNTGFRDRRLPRRNLKGA